VDCSGVKTSDDEGDAEVLEAVAKAGAGDNGDEEDEGVAGDKGMVNGDGSSGVEPLAIPCKAPTTFSQAFSKTRTLSFNSLFSLSLSDSRSLGGVMISMVGVVMIGVAVTPKDWAARAARSASFSFCSSVT
jgi:hypothetical protein